jgi:hypothetical protein
MAHEPKRSRGEELEDDVVVKGLEKELLEYNIYGDLCAQTDSDLLERYIDHGKVNLVDLACATIARLVLESGVAVKDRLEVLLECAQKLRRPSEVWWTSGEGTEKERAVAVLDVDTEPSTMTMKNLENQCHEIVKKKPGLDFAALRGALDDLLAVRGERDAEGWMEEFDENPCAATHQALCKAVHEMNALAPDMDDINRDKRAALLVMKKMATHCEAWTATWAISLMFKYGSYEVRVVEEKVLPTRPFVFRPDVHDDNIVPACAKAQLL